MSSRETDISLIRKYLEGALDARAMHQLEKRAQEDPFLMDAIEGYENIGADQEPNLTELSTRLAQRITKKEQRIIPWRFMAIAASVLLVTSIGAALLFNRGDEKAGFTKTADADVKTPLAIPKVPPPLTPDKGNQIAKIEPQKLVRSKQRLVAAATVVDRPLATASAAPASVFEPSLASTTANKEADSAKGDTTPLNEMIVMGYAAQKKKAPAGALAADKVKDVKIAPLVTDQPLQAKATGVTTTIPPVNENYTRQYLAGNLITGRVIGRDDGMPIPGATVKIKGTNTATQTDANGRFSIAAKAAQQNLQVGFIGYQTTEIVAGKKDSSETISLAPNNAQLAEVVVTRTSKPDNGEDAAVTAAHPEAGWNALKKYLKENAKSADGKTGVVKLVFMVSTNGTVYDVKVTKSLSPDADQKAIDLINEGPNWTASSSGKPEKVSLRVRFDK